MGGRLDRERKRKHARELNRKYRLPAITHCPNCNKKFEKGDSGHFVPPGGGDSGMWACELFKK
jgi:hypothetical protein